LFPFLKTTSEAKSFEYLRVTSLGVLAKVDDTEAVKFLLKNEVIPLCLRIMGTGSELSKTVATFIVQRIMLDEVGLQHICATPECFFEAANVLANMVVALAEQPSTRLLKHVIHCYIRLMDDPRAYAGLRTHLPEALRNGTFDNCLRDDPAAKHVLQKLLDKLAGPTGGAPHPCPGPAAGRSHGGPAQAGPSHTPWCKPIWLLQSRIGYSDAIIFQRIAASGRWCTALEQSVMLQFITVSIGNEPVQCAVVVIGAANIAVPAVILLYAFLIFLDTKNWTKSVFEIASCMI
jgi:hypothetical protein